MKHIFSPDLFVFFKTNSGVVLRSLSSSDYKTKEVEKGSLASQPSTSSSSRSMRALISKYNIKQTKYEVRLACSLYTHTYTHTFKAYKKMRFN